METCLYVLLLFILLNLVKSVSCLIEVTNVTTLGQSREVNVQGSVKAKESKPGMWNEDQGCEKKREAQV